MGCITSQGPDVLVKRPLQITCYRPASDWWRGQGYRSWVPSHVFLAYAFIVLWVFWNPTLPLHFCLFPLPPTCHLGHSASDSCLLKIPFPVEKPLPADFNPCRTQDIFRTYSSQTSVSEFPYRQTVHVYCCGHHGKRPKPDKVDRLDVDTR